MIRVEVGYFSNVRTLTGEPGSTMELPDGSAVSDLLIAVAARYGDDLPDIPRRFRGYFTIPEELEEDA